MEVANEFKVDPDAPDLTDNKFTSTNELFGTDVKCEKIVVKIDPFEEEEQEDDFITPDFIIPDCKTSKPEGVNYDEYTAGNTTVECVVCGHFYSDSINLGHHLLRQHVSPGSLTCPIPTCSKVLPTSTLLKSHITRHAGKKFGRLTVTSYPRRGLEPYSRRLLSSSFGSIVTSSQKKKVVPQDFCFKCPICDEHKPTKDHDDVTTHIFYTHVENGSLNCPICSTFCAVRGALKVHIGKHVRLQDPSSSSSSSSGTKNKPAKKSNLVPCPYPNCTTRISLNLLKSHLKSHSK